MTDTSGKVYVDVVTPTTVQAGASYSPAMSQVVSNMGTYPKPAPGQLGATVQGFTSTLSTSSVPVSPALAGAPPIVVQDQWAIVSATPTGFTITDASSHQILVSETTASPVTGIAIDTNLNVAYLVMPDSNTLLTLPLPGMPGSNPAAPVTAAPYNDGSYVNNGSQEVDFTLTLYDNTPGAAIFYQTSCPGDQGQESSGGSFEVYFQVYSGCSPSGTMYAQAPGLLPSATVSINFP